MIPNRLFGVCVSRIERDGCDVVLNAFYLDFICLFGHEFMRFSFKSQAST